MKKIIIAVIIAVISLTAITQLAFARTFPGPVNYVSDFAGVIKPETETQLNSELKSFEDQTSNQISVVTLTSLQGDTIENTAEELFRQWGIGQKNKDNGVLLLIVPNEKKLRIEVGYGLEPTLTDSRAGTIIRDVITPPFKQNDYDSGVVDGVKAIQTVLVSDPGAFDQPINSSSEDGSDKMAFFIFLGFAIVYLSAFLARSKRYWPGGVIGVVLGLLFVSVTGAFFLGIWGLLLDYLLSKNYKKRKSLGLPTSWWSSAGGFSSGRSSSGGFGGFGGGSSGGGGASGSW